MSPVLRAVLPYLIGAAVLAVALAGWRVDRHFYGASQYQAGVNDERMATRARELLVAQAMQQEKDRADAQYRGAVLAREAAEKTVAAQRGRIDGLLRQLAQRRSEAAGTSGRPDAAGPDWIGIIGSCVGRYEQLGKDAARWADQVNGLQGYIRGLGVAP